MKTEGGLKIDQLLWEHPNKYWEKLVLIRITCLVVLVLAAFHPQLAGIGSAQCVEGRSVPRDFFTAVLNYMGIPASSFALDALEAWKPYENTSACWNPLATTWDMPGSSDFNSVGVKNYPDSDTGSQATANTINLSYYEGIQNMLRLDSFDRDKIRAGLNTWSGNGGYVDTLLNEWEVLWNQGIVTPTTQNTATALVVDVSGSMSENWQGGIKIESAKSAAHQVVNMIEQESQAGSVSHQVGLASFSDNGYRDLDLTTDYGMARAAIDNLFPQSSTNMGEGLSIANDILSQASAGEDKFIILLSDGLTNAGMSPDQIMAGPVQDAVGAGTCIYTVGFGDPGSIDEDLLRRIAAASGCGEYYHGTVPSDLEKIYIRIRHESIGNIIGEFSGTVAQGEIVEAGTFNVDPGQGELALTLHWPGSRLNLRLRDPGGSIIDANSPGVNFVTYQNLIYALIFQPIPGSWLVEVIGEDVPQDTELYDVIVSARAAPPTPVLPTPTPLPLPQPQSTSGFPVAILLLVLGGGGVALYVYAGILRRKRATVVGLGAAQARLILLKGDRSEQVVNLGDQPVTIGRGSANTLQIPDPGVSRLHATIRYAGGSWYLQDQGSKTGSFVNNQVVTATRLINGDRIRLGSTEFIFRSENP